MIDGGEIDIGEYKSHPTQRTREWLCEQERLWHPVQIAGGRSTWYLNPKEAKGSYVDIVELTLNSLAWNRRSLTGSPVSLRQAGGQLVNMGVSSSIGHRRT